VPARHGAPGRAKPNDARTARGRACGRDESTPCKIGELRGKEGTLRSRFSVRQATRLIALAALALLLAALAGCAAGSERFVDEPAGFWIGLWHGLIVVITFVISLFTDSVGVYELNNSGNWYDFGFMLGLLISVGGTFRGHRKTKKVRLHEDEWERIGAKVEAKVRRGIDNWLDERDKTDEEWEEIGKKIEEKIKRELRDWAES